MARSELSVLPDYLMIGEASLPVSKLEGKVWKKKIDESLEVFKVTHDLWSDAFEAYSDCPINRQEDAGQQKLKISSDENIIRDNVKVLMRSSYTTNPSVLFLTDDAEDQPLAKLYENILNSLFNRTAYPGLNLRPYARKHILHAHLTNFGVLKLVHQTKRGSRQEALGVIEKLRKRISTEKNNEQLQLLYQELVIAQEELPARENAGIRLENPLGQTIIVDPKCSSIDLNDADWIAEELWLDNDYLKKKFMEIGKEGEWVRRSDGQVASALDHSDTGDVKEDVTNRVLNANDMERQEYIRKDATKCYMIYDKITRMWKLFSTQNWAYPLWVWDDPLQLSRFFPFFILAFDESIDGIVQPGAVSFYKHHIDNVNKRNRKFEMIVNSVFGSLLYNSRATDEDTVKKFLQHLTNPDSVKALGVKLEEGTKWEDVLTAYVPPSGKYPELFDTTPLKAKIDQVANISPAMRGGEFRTNTTTEAVQFYSKTYGAQSADHSDQIEWTYEQLAWAIAEIVASKYDKETIITLIGKAGEAFRSMSVEEFNQRFSTRIVAGSTEKPNTQSRKEEAIQLVQLLGQFGQATPMATMTIAIKLLSAAFTNLDVTQEDWAMLKQEAQAFLTKGQSTPTDNGAPTNGN